MTHDAEERWNQSPFLDDQSHLDTEVRTLFSDLGGFLGGAVTGLGVLGATLYLGHELGSYIAQELELSRGATAATKIVATTSASIPGFMLGSFGAWFGHWPGKALGYVAGIGYESLEKRIVK